MAGQRQVCSVPVDLVDQPWWSEALHSRRLLYVSLYLHADERGMVRASYATMGKWLTTVSKDMFGRQTTREKAPPPTTVKGSLAWLVEHGAIRHGVEGSSVVTIVDYVSSVPPPEDAPYTGDVPYAVIVAAYNGAASLNGGRLRQCRGLGEQRKAHLRARWQEAAFRENYARVFEMAAGSSLAKAWRGLDLDWLVKNGQNYLKVLEGKYPSEAEAVDAGAGQQAAAAGPEGRGAKGAAGNGKPRGRTFGDGAQELTAFEE